jgi:phosphatidylglycerophosphatase A
LPDARRLEPGLRLMLRHPAHWFAFGFGTGLAPKAPGPFGTLLGLPLYLLLAQLSPAGFWIALLLCAGFGVWCCDVAGKALGVSDHGAIVWDEVVAFALVLAFTPATWPWWLAAFVAFRLFDILKPWPISWLDRTVKGGLGVMLDDLLAALFSIVLVRLAMHIL